MARSKKTHLIDPVEDGVDPRLAVLAAIRDELPPEDEAATPTLPPPSTPTPTPAPTAIPTPAPAPASTPTDLSDLLEGIRQVEARAQAARREAEAKKAEADALRADLERLAQARREAQGLLRRLQAQRVWAGEVEGLEVRVMERLRVLEAEAQAASCRLQELEADEGVRRLRAEEEAHRQAEAARQRAEEARQLLREGKVTEALRLLARAEGEEAARARDEALQVARRLVGGALFRARQALEDGDHQGVVRAAQQVAHLLPHMGGPDRQALQGLFCRAAAALAPADLPLVLIRGRKVERRGRVVWTARPGLLAVGTPVQGGAKVLFNLGTPWEPGRVVPPEEAEILPLRARHGQTAKGAQAKSSSS